MNWEQIEGNWKQFKGGVKEQWGKLTDDELTRIDGKRDKLAGLLQEKYGLAKQAVATAFDRVGSRNSCTDFPEIIALSEGDGFPLSPGPGRPG